MTELRSYLHDRLISLQGITWHTPVSDELALQIVAIEKEGLSASDLKNGLKDDHNIETRWMGSHGMNGIRISLAIYNTEEDIDTLVKAVDSMNG